MKFRKGDTLKKPMGPFNKLSKEESEEKLQKVRDLNLTREEENQLIWQAIKTIFLPVFIFFMVVLGLVFLIF